VCPSPEVLRLCLTARFPIASGSSSLTLDGLPLNGTLPQPRESCCGHNGDAVDPQRYVSWRALLKLHLGHSWVREPLAAALALAHLAPHADTLRWFHEKNRLGFVETHDVFFFLRAAETDLTIVCSSAIRYTASGR